MFASPLPAVPATASETAGRIIGVDVGLHRTGYAILAAGPAADSPRLIEAGVVRISREKALETRLVELESGLATLLREHQPAALACEDLYAHYKHPRTAIRMGHARGVVLALAARSGLSVSHINATQIKKMLTGNGHASKAQMQRAVAGTLRLGRLPEPHDVADAIAIGLAGLRLLDAKQRGATARRTSP
jgi:crossover junction endodeoxyribonuclease RuvC